MCWILYFPVMHISYRWVKIKTHAMYSSTSPFSTPMICLFVKSPCIRCDNQLYNCENNRFLMCAYV
jgi:hypothetical protein